MGENGAGKSTLMKCLLGLYRPDSGRILFKGEELRIPHPSVALAKGIAMIHQELNPVAERPVMENIWLGRFPRRRFGPLSFVDAEAMHVRTRAIFEDLELNLDPRERRAISPWRKCR
jgi:ABC-type sugar transport system ATPase subunit